MSYRSEGEPVTTQPYRVVLVVDRNAGDRIPELARAFHVWVVESPINTPAIQRFWLPQRTAPEADPLGPGITSFKASEAESTEEICARIAADVDEHHGEYAHDPRWSEIAVYGTSLSKRLQETLAQLGATEFEMTQEGFVCRR